MNQEPKWKADIKKTRTFSIVFFFAMSVLFTVFALINFPLVGKGRTSRRSRIEAYQNFEGDPFTVDITIWWLAVINSLALAVWFILSPRWSAEPKITKRMDSQLQEKLKTRFQKNLLLRKIILIVWALLNLIPPLMVVYFWSSGTEYSNYYLPRVDNLMYGFALLMTSFPFVWTVFTLIKPYTPKDPIF